MTTLFMKTNTQKYMKRFKGTRPLTLCIKETYPDKCMPILVESEIERFDVNRGNRFPEKDYKIIGGFKKAKLEDFINYDWLYGNGMWNLFHERLVAKMSKICPNDFQPIQVTLVNLSKEVVPYKVRDFYIVNTLNYWDTLDHEKSVMKDCGDNFFLVSKFIFKEDPWQGHHLVTSKIRSYELYHPELALAMHPSKQFWFRTERDMNWKYDLRQGIDKIEELHKLGWTPEQMYEVPQVKDNVRDLEAVKDILKDIKNNWRSI